MELNEQTLDQILTRQREEYQNALAQQGERFDRALTEQGERFDHALTEQGERFDRSLILQREEFQLYMGSQVEGLRSDIQLLAESVSGVQEQLIALREMVAKNTADIEIMKVEMLAVKTNFAGMSAEMEGVRLEMEMIRSELSIIRNDLKAKTGRDEVAVLEARVAKLERIARARP